MSKKYGGVNNKKSIEEIQEAEVVTAPIFRKKQPKSKAGVVFGWLIYWIVSWVIIFLFMCATGLYEQLLLSSMPWWVACFIIPSVPFLLTLIWTVIQFKKVKKQKDAGD